MNAKFTPKPWNLFSSGSVHEISASDNIPVVTWSGFDDSRRPNSVHQANARLITAAPELLEALEELSDLMAGVLEGTYLPDSFTLQPARAAIAKATGEA